MVKSLPSVVAYHAKIYVRRPDKSVVKVCVDCDDYYGDSEITEALVKIFSCNTFGELVKAISLSFLPMNPPTLCEGLIRVALRPSFNISGTVREWDEPLINRP